MERNELRPRKVHPCMEPFWHRFRTSIQDGKMKSLLTSRSEIRWLVLAVPSILVAHWILTSVGARLMSLVPASLQAVLHLL